MNTKDDYIISRAGKRDGENLLQERDAKGRPFIQSMINHAVAAEPGETIVERYPWKERGGRENTQESGNMHLLCAMGLGDLCERL